MSRPLYLRNGWGRPRRRYRSTYSVAWYEEPWRVALLLAAVFVAVLVMVVVARPADAQDRVWTVPQIIDWSADWHGASREQMRRVAWCESRFNPYAVGDGGSSHGLYQLNDWSTGLIWHFYAVGYSNPYSAWESSDYYARVAVGTWAHEGVGVWRWSCR